MSLIILFHAGYEKKSIEEEKKFMMWLKHNKITIKCDIIYVECFSVVINAACT